MQMSVGDPFVHLGRGEPERQELPSRYDTVLQIGQHGDQPLTWFIEFRYFRNSMNQATHAVIVAEKV